MPDMNRPHWIKEGTDKGCRFICSECKGRVYFIDSVPGKGTKQATKCRYRFCPWCKAEIDLSFGTVYTREEAVQYVNV